MRKLLTSVALSAALLTSANMATAQSAEATIAENAMAVSDFSTLVAAVQAAGLADELMGDGPFTVFAPTNEAFAALPDGALDDLLKPENQPALISVLQAHIIPAIITSDDLSTLVLTNNPAVSDTINISVEGGVITTDTLDTTDLRIEKNGDSFYVSTLPGATEQAKIVQADIVSSNGVIHVIDKVLLPAF